MAESDKKALKPKQPSVLKRKAQSDKRKLRNRSHKSRVVTAMRKLTTSIESKEAAEQVKENLNVLYSLMDKGVKTGVFKANKAARTKARFTARIAS